MQDEELDDDDVGLGEEDEPTRPDDLDNFVNQAPESADESHASLAFLKDFIMDKFPASRPPLNAEHSASPAYILNSFYPSQFPKQPKEGKDLKYCRQMEDVCVKAEAAWSDQAARDSKRLDPVFPKRSTFYRGSHES